MLIGLVALVGLVAVPVLPGRPTVLLAPAVITPSTGFILGSLPGFGTLVFSLVIAEILRDRFGLPPWVFGGLIAYRLANTPPPGLILRPTTAPAHPVEVTDDASAVATARVEE